MPMLRIVPMKGGSNYLGLAAGRGRRLKAWRVEKAVKVSALTAPPDKSFEPTAT